MAAPYTLGERQLACYKSLVNLWKPNPHVQDAQKRSTRTHSYPVTPTHANVVCRLQPKSEASKPQKFGRTNHDIVVTTDMLRVHLDQEIDDGWLVQLVTPDHPEINTYFVTQGGTQSFDNRAKSRVIFLKRVNKPTFIDP